MMLRRLAGSWLTLPAFLLACDSSLGITCTSIGCLGGLTVVIADAPPDVPITVVAREGNVSSDPIACPAQNDRCRLTFANWYPDEVTLEITWAEEVRTITVRPGYEVVQPNGPSCEPTCEVGLVEVSVQDLPGARSAQAKWQ